ncbi:MAG TPA: cytochrome c, partial [Stellaceae bacterium]|nr:cytochrome c [Stellaceae bacterium]
MRSAGAKVAAVVGLAVLAAGRALAGDGIDPQDFKQVERGRYLAIVGDCAGCHTLPGSGHDFAGGRPLETPFGTMLAPNITPDPDTGIGSWTDDEFVNALTKGTGRGGMQLYPAMPYTYMTKASRQDALAIRAYLNTVPAVRNKVEANQLPFPFNIRSTLGVWNAMFFTRGQFYPVAEKSAEWNRGAYLTEGLAHCGMCHTPKNFLGGDKDSERLRGYALQGWYAPDITNDNRRGLGGWSVDDIVAYLKTGHNRTSAATGPMSETIGFSTSHMTDDDLKAIATYLKDQPGQEQKPPPAADSAVMKMGEKIYADECSGCHTPNGKGVPGMIPSISGSPVVQQADATSLMRVVLRGARSTATDEAPTGPAMPAFGWLLSDDQVAAVVTYVRNAWG